MGATRFLDTNILLYAFAGGDPRAAVAEQILADGGAISVQVLNEFVSVCRRKLGLDWPEIEERLSILRELLDPPSAITDEIHLEALAIAKRQNLNLYDALIVASAAALGCKQLLTEDMSDGQRVSGVKIQNPFAA